MCKEQEVAGSTFVTVINGPGINGSSLLGELLNTGVTVISSGPRAAHAGVVNILALNRARLIFASAPNFRGPRGGLNRCVGGTINSDVNNASSILFMARPHNRLSSGRLRLVGGLGRRGQGIVLTVGGVSVLGSGGRLFSHVICLAGFCSFSTIIPISTAENSKVSRLRSRLVGATYRDIRCFPSSALASRPREILTTRVVERGVLHLVSGRIPRKVTITIRGVHRHRSGSVLSVSTAVCYRQRARGNVVVNGRNTVLGGVSAFTERSLRDFFRVGMGLRA